MNGTGPCAAIMLLLAAGLSVPARVVAATGEAQRVEAECARRQQDLAARKAQWQRIGHVRRIVSEWEHIVVALDDGIRIDPGNPTVTYFVFDTKRISLKSAPKVRGREVSIPLQDLREFSAIRVGNAVYRGPNRIRYLCSDSGSSHCRAVEAQCPGGG